MWLEGNRVDGIYKGKLLEKSEICTTRSLDKYLGAPGLQQKKRRRSVDVFGVLI